MKRRYFFSFLLLAVLSANLYGQVSPSATDNYVIEYTPQKAYTNFPSIFAAEEVQASIAYFDGLGRPRSVVLPRATPDKSKDIISSYKKYDYFGRVSNQYLPVPSTTVGGSNLPENTIGIQGSTFYADSYFYTKTTYEPSPLSRVLNNNGARSKLA